MTLLNELNTALKQGPPESENEESYREELAAIALAAWAGDIGHVQAQNRMNEAVAENLRQAWVDGAAEGGVGEDDLTIDEEEALQGRIDEELAFVAAYIIWLMSHQQVDGVSPETVINRAEGWASRWNEVLTQGRGMAASDQKEKWVWDPQKEHCSDCRNLNGRVYRNSTWNRWGIYPQSSSLECFGTHCGCRRVPTDEPVTPGRPPALVGP